jgi:hypothetical protein
MKDKDPNDDELNKDEEDNINEADDSFGLPDLEFNELDEDSAEEESSDSDSENVEESEDSGEQGFPPEEDAEEPYNEDESEVFDAEEEEEPPKTSYVPPKPESNTPKIIAFLIIVVLATAGIWYFGFYRPKAAAEEKARIEAADKKAKADALAAEKKRAEEERLAAEQSANEAADEDEQASQESTFTTISESTGRYYIVIESFVDSDMAADHGKDLATKGFSTALLSPQGKRKFHRLTVGDFDTFVAAQEEANKLKAEFGEDLWVLKY